MRNVDPCDVPIAREPERANRQGAARRGRHFHFRNLKGKKGKERKKKRRNHEELFKLNKLSLRGMIHLAFPILGRRTYRANVPVAANLHGERRVKDGKR